MQKKKKRMRKCNANIHRRAGRLLKFTIIQAIGTKREIEEWTQVTRLTRAMREGGHSSLDVQLTGCLLGERKAYLLVEADSHTVKVISFQCLHSIFFFPELRPPLQPSYFWVTRCYVIWKFSKIFILTTAKYWALFILAAGFALHQKPALPSPWGKRRLVCRFYRKAPSPIPALGSAKVLINLRASVWPTCMRMNSVGRSGNYGKWGIFKKTVRWTATKERFLCFVLS